ncbi:secreted protein, partial [sediment metagenome]
MKKFLKVLIILGIVLISHSTFSQNPERFPAVRERIINAKFDEICRRMELENSKAEELRPVYR